MRDFGYNIYKALQNAPEKKEDEKDKKKDAKDKKDSEVICQLLERRGAGYLTFAGFLVSSFVGSFAQICYNYYFSRFHCISVTQAQSLTTSALFLLLQVCNVVSMQ